MELKDGFMWITTHDYEASNSAISSGFIIYEERPVSTYTNEKILGVDTNQDIVEVDRNTLFKNIQLYQHQQVLKYK